MSRRLNTDRNYFSTSQFGLIPKSDTFQYLTVSDQFSEMKDKLTLFEIGNLPRISDDEEQHFLIPQRSSTVTFHMFAHYKEELSGQKLQVHYVFTKGTSRN